MIASISRKTVLLACFRLHLIEPWYVGYSHGMVPWFASSLASEAIRGWISAIFLSDWRSSFEQIHDDDTRTTCRNASPSQKKATNNQRKDVPSEICPVMPSSAINPRTISPLEPAPIGREARRAGFVAKPEFRRLVQAVRCLLTIFSRRGLAGINGHVYGNRWQVAES